MTNGNRIKSLNGLRGALALVVVLFHSGVINSRAVWMTVSLFFILSGFVHNLSHGGMPCTRGNVSRLLLQRLRRLYPIHLLTLLLVVATTGFAMSNALVANALLLQCYVPVAGVNMSYNVPSWFLCDIVFCYILALPCGALLRPLRLRWRVLAVVAATAAVAMAVSVVNNKYYSYFFPPTRFVEFAAGMVACDVWRWLRSRRPAAAGTAAEITALCVLLAVLGGAFLVPLERQCVLHGAVWVLPGAALIIALSGEAGAVSRLLNCRAAQWAGSISLEVYMLQQLVITLYSKSYFAAMGGGGLALRAALIIATLLAAAWLTKRFFTVPAAKWLAVKA